MWPSKLVEDVASEIAVLRGINGGNLPQNEEEFWAQLALSVASQPESTVRATAEAVASALSVEFDEDYLNSDDDSPSLNLYEAILSAIKNWDGDDARSSTRPESDEDEGDDEEVEFKGVMANVPPINSTIRELMTQVNEGSLVLNPEWQRGFVWKLQKQRRLIESILLGLPIPSFLFFEDSASGKSYVIDGRQRLETISRFMAPKEEKGKPKVRFKTFNGKTAGWSPDQPLAGAANKYFHDLPDHFRSKFAKSALVTFTFKDIPPDQLYQIFKRYNTGAVALNAAEIRNAVYQASQLHGMMFRMGGEYRDPSKYKDDDERQVGETLRQTMPRGKLERYGAYDFIGRYFAFRYQRTGSVAAATNAFMQKYAKDDSRVESFRQEFIATFRTTLKWYKYPLVEPSESGAFHAMLATLQLVSTAEALDLIAANRVAETAVKERIAERWPVFCEQILQEKQNSTLFWSAREQWNSIVSGV